MKDTLSVRFLAEFVHRRGDLHARLDGRARAEEGIQAQRKLQRGRGPAYERERRVALTREVGGRAHLISGRVDGADLTARLVEEYKTTRADPELAQQKLGSAHWAQVKLYGGMLVEELDGASDSQWTLRLVYCHPDTLATREFDQQLSGHELATFLDETLDSYAGWVAMQLAHERNRNEAIARRDFPFPRYRPHQQAVARRVYRALRDREQLLLEAPTGSGKSMALLFPAAKALAATDHQKIFYLTSRSTGSLAALDACERLDPDGDYLRRVHIVARERACPVEGVPCDPALCQYANGYYDRIHGALAELLERPVMDAPRVAEVAEAHRVCPHELSLDAAVWADVLVGDYNYVFDPMVRLQRFAEDPGIALLVDEAHQLSTRARDMLSLEVTRSAVQQARVEQPPAAILRRVRSVERKLVEIASAQRRSGETSVPRPDPLIRAMARLVDEVAGSDVDIAPYPATRSLLMTCYRWVRGESWYDEACCAHLGDAPDGDYRLRRVHLDPAAYLKGVFDGFGGHVRFSGSVSPLPLYQRLHGTTGAPAERAGSPFDPEQLEVLVVDDVPTYLAARARSLERLAALVETVVSANRGHYLVALPSFAYLDDLAWALAGRESLPDVAVQTPGMPPEERDRFLERFGSGSPACIGLVVMGGVFAESVDFAGRLAGVICVGVGLPPPEPERARLQAHFAGVGEDGNAVAYQQPAMIKVLQMAGRLLRDPEDRGILCLVDDRFKDSAYGRFFPAHWRPQAVRAAQVAGRLEKFWQGAAGSPRLRA